MENLGSTNPTGDGGVPPKRYSEPSNEASKRESQQWKERGRQSQIFDGQNDVPQKTVTKTWKDAGRHCEIFDEKYNAPLKTPQRNWPWQERARRSSILDNSWQPEDNSVSNQKRHTASTTRTTPNRRSSPSPTKEGGDASYSPSRSNADVVDTSNSPSLKSVAGDAPALSSPKLDNGNASPSRKSNNGNTPHSPSRNGNSPHSPSRNSDTAESRSPHKWPWQEKALVSDIFGYQPSSRYGHDTGKLKKDYAWNQTKCTHDFGGNYSSNDRFQRGPNLGLSNTQAKNLKKANVTNGNK